MMEDLRAWWARFDFLEWLINVLIVTWMFALVGYALLAVLFLAGCSTTADNPCSMASMTAAQLERALVMGCGK